MTLHRLCSSAGKAMFHSDRAMGEVVDLSPAISPDGRTLIWPQQSGKGYA